MNAYEKHVLPRIINVLCDMKVAHEQRERVCAGLSGEVVEIGFGSGLRELRRVLKPGGTLHFVEHGLVPDEKVRAWQHRLNPVQHRLFGGCNLNRPTVELLQGAGFEIEHVDNHYEKGSPKFLGAHSLGVARSA